VHESKLMQPTAEDQLMIVDGLPELFPPRDNDWRAFLPESKQDGSNPGVCDHDPSMGDHGKQFLIWQKVDKASMSETTFGASSLNKNLVVARLRNRIGHRNEAVERLACSDRENDHEVEKMVPSKCARGTSSTSSGHWT